MERKMIYMDDAKQAILDLPNAYNGFSDSYDKSCIIDVLESLPTAQTEKRTEERTETHSCDCISRRAAIDATWFEPSYTDPLNVLTEVRDRLKVLPSAQPERKKGEWILAEDGWYCSVCELYPPFDCDPEEKGIPYCPNCGADMKGEEHETD